MPEYLAPGVFVEEVSFRAKTIEGVATSTTGFAGMTRYGPVNYTPIPAAVSASTVPPAVQPRLITSFAEYERVFGGLEPLLLSGAPEINYMANAVRAFFENGGRRLYVSRVFPLPSDGATEDSIARLDIPLADPNNPPPPAVIGTWTARWPGAFGNVLVTVRPTRSRNIAVTAAGLLQARGARHGALVEFTLAANPDPADNDALDPAQLLVVEVDADGVQTFRDSAGSPTVPALDTRLRLVELTVLVGVAADREDVYDGLGVHPDHRRAITRILQRDDPADEDSVVWLDWQSTGTPAVVAAESIALAVALAGSGPARLTAGDDGVVMTPGDLTGEATDPDDPRPTGLHALAEVEDIAIVAAPDAGSLADPLAAAQALITHAELCRYRIAIVDGPAEATLGEIRGFRASIDSTRAALYHPWVLVLDPLERAAQGAPPTQLALPPSGFVAGIYARSDNERGVWKAPANEVVRGITRFEANINTGRQEVINPEGINALRFFEGRGNRVWGARTVSSDPEWKYVNVRRLFIYLEHSIDRSTQWAVFEPNGDRLWANVRQTVEDFLFNEWRNGALLGTKPEEAYFVRCDRTTMTQNDLDNGRLVCLIGVAPVRPAEFVIFRIGQWTAESAAV